MIKKVSIAIQGVSPLLMHSFPLQPIEALDKKTPEEQAEAIVYRDPETKSLYIPSVAVQRGLINAAVYSKGKGRGSLQRSAAACLLVSPERLSLGVTNYAIDSRPVVIAATKGRIVRHRPRLDHWKVTFELEFDDTLIKQTELRRIVDDLGQRVGLLEYRPEKKGPFGRFMVTSWNGQS